MRRKREQQAERQRQADEFVGYVSRPHEFSPAVNVGQDGILSHDQGVSLTAFQQRATWDKMPSCPTITGFTRP
jgi:hypothetical protein